MAVSERQRARIEDYALLGDCQSAALVSRAGSIDWLCLPRFDSGACFAALLGDDAHGFWSLAPTRPAQTRRRYRGDTLVLETIHETADGVVAVIDFMPVRSRQPDVVRIVEGRAGRVQMATELVARFDYGSAVPWVRHTADGIMAIAGPDTLHLRTPVKLRGEDFRTHGTFQVAAGERVPFVLTWHPSHEPTPQPVEADAALGATEAWWLDWSARCTVRGDWRGPVMRSLLTLKALTYGPTGGIVAAATTSLPECIGGERNWDYRFCWLRDATFTLYALLRSGYLEEARAWREWLMRAVAGRAAQLQIVYGVAGERRLPEIILPWLPGYEGSAPVRVGNAAADQFQLDVFGEVLDALHAARRSGLQATDEGWRVERELIEFLESRWTEPDEGIWEVRGPRRHFTYSKVMAWVALDRAVADAERFGLPAPMERWRTLREEIHADVLRHGYDERRGTFVQSYGSPELDASLLVLPQVGFLPAKDPRVVGTVRAVEKALYRDGFVHRYSTATGVDGLPPGEGTFVLCSFWLADAWILQGRRAEARELFERLLATCNDVGLLAEEYDSRARRQLGNFPQAFSHVGLINTARNLENGTGPAQDRPD